MKKVIPYIDEAEERAYKRFRDNVNEKGDLRPLITHRECKQCKTKLDSSRYSFCITCKSELESDDGDLIYWGSDS